MSIPLEIKQFAYHYVDPKLDQPVYSEQAQPAGDLPAVIQDFLLAMVSEIWTAPDAGSTRSARFAQGGDPAEDSQVKPLFDSICQDEGQFFPASRALAALLHQRSHPSASPGLLAVLHLKHIEKDTTFLALIKVHYKDEQFVRLHTGERPRLEVEQMHNILVKDIQKGALIPHPTKHKYDLKVIDAQARNDPAAYFTEKFLGCVSKKSDDLQVRNLVPVLERYAEEKELPMAVERVAQVIETLQQQPENISTPLLAEAVAGQALFGEAFEQEDFIVYVQESSLGELDIPKEQFERKQRTIRRVIYRFVDPQYEGLEISGPPEAFRKILNADGGEVVFTVKTSNDGFQFRYQ